MLSNKPDTKGQLLYDSHLYEISKVGKFIGTEGRYEVTRDWDKRRMGNYCLQGTDLFSEVMKKF